MFSADHRRRVHRFAVATRAALLLVTVAGCSDGNGIVAPVVPSVAECNGVSVAVRNLAPLESVVISGADAACFALAGEGRDYLVVPQLVGASLPYGGYGFRLGNPTTVTASVVSNTPDPAWLQMAQGRAIAEPPMDAQARLDARMRARERSEPRGAAVPQGAPQLSVSGAVPAAPAELRTFSVLNTLDAVEAYSPVNARLRFSGAKMLLYVDTLAQAALSEQELQSIGSLYDERLTPAVTSNFGDGSDIDGNQRVIFLLTPTVNALVSKAQCGATGFVRGFFFSHDLRSTNVTSNRGEVFYGYVPDESGQWSCAHSKAEVLANLPPTFMHELQHMLSYGEHAVKRNGPAEEGWLNEGLSHMAEEVGSLIYESRFPAPTGRTTPTSIFPDSATPFINPNLLYSYRYLFSSATFSLTGCAPGTFCTLSERGGTWLWLRWMADQRTTRDFRAFVETSRTGRANLEAVTGRSTAELLGNFVLAVSADSIPGVARTAVSARLRFTSRNLRRIYRGLFEAYGVIGGVGRPFPIEPLPLVANAAVTGTMRPGTFLTYRMSVPAGTPSALLRMRALDGTPFPESSGAQVSVLRLP